MTAAILILDRALRMAEDNNRVPTPPYPRYPVELRQYITDLQDAIRVLTLEAAKQNTMASAVPATTEGEPKP
jgi:hypothetical protein